MKRNVSSSSSSSSMTESLVLLSFCSRRSRFPIDDRIVFNAKAQQQQLFIYFSPSAVLSSNQEFIVAPFACISVIVVLLISFRSILISFSSRSFISFFFSLPSDPKSSVFSTFASTDRTCVCVCLCWQYWIALFVHVALIIIDNKQIIYALTQTPCGAHSTQSIHCSMRPSLSHSAQYGDDRM